MCHGVGLLSFIAPAFIAFSTQNHIFQIRNISSNYWVGQKVHSGSTIRSYTKTWNKLLVRSNISLIILSLLFPLFALSGTTIQILFFQHRSSNFHLSLLLLHLFFFFFWLSRLWELLNFIFQPFWKVSIFCYHCFNLNDLVSQNFFKISCSYFTTAIYSISLKILLMVLILFVCCLCYLVPSSHLLVFLYSGVYFSTGDFP